MAARSPTVRNCGSLFNGMLTSKWSSTSIKRSMIFRELSSSSAQPTLSAKNFSNAVIASNARTLGGGTCDGHGEYSFFYNGSREAIVHVYAHLPP